MGFSLYEFRDHDLMSKLADLGPMSTKDIAAEIGVDGEGVNAAGSRLAWMRRFGLLTRSDQGNWDLSKSGERIVAAKRRAALKNLIDQMPEGELIEAMAYITSRYRHGDPALANMLRREFLYGTAAASRVWRLP